MQGIKLAAIYSYPPSSLHLCGVQNPQTVNILNDYLSENNIDEKGVRQVLRQFEAAYPYYELIAKINGIGDPLSFEVVEAYWLGNDLLNQVTKKDLQELIFNQFQRPGLLSAKDARKRANEVPEKAIPHHSFHVLILGSVTGRVQFQGKLYDLCCVNSAEVIEVKKASLKVKRSPLAVKDGKFVFQKSKEQTIDWSQKILPKIKVGNIVSTHWNQACQIISPDKAKEISRYTQINIEAVNSRSK